MRLAGTGCEKVQRAGSLCQEWLPARSPLGSREQSPFHGGGGVPQSNRMGVRPRSKRLHMRGSQSRPPPCTCPHGRHATVRRPHRWPGAGSSHSRIHPETAVRATAAIALCPSGHCRGQLSDRAGDRSTNLSHYTSANPASPSEKSEIFAIPGAAGSASKRMRRFIRCIHSTRSHRRRFPRTRGPEKRITIRGSPRLLPDEVDACRHCHWPRRSSGCSR